MERLDESGLIESVHVLQTDERVVVSVQVEEGRHDVEDRVLVDLYFVDLAETAVRFFDEERCVVELEGLLARVEGDRDRPGVGTYRRKEVADLRQLQFRSFAK